MPVDYIFKVALGDPMKERVKTFPFVSNKEKIKENLINRFPKEKEGIEKFFELLKVTMMIHYDPYKYWYFGYS